MCPEYGVTYVPERALRASGNPITHNRSGDSQSLLTQQTGIAYEMDPLRVPPPSPIECNGE